LFILIENRINGWKSDNAIISVYAVTFRAFESFLAQNIGIE